MKNLFIFFKIIVIVVNLFSQALMAQNIDVLLDEGSLDKAWGLHQEKIQQKRILDFVLGANCPSRFRCCLESCSTRLFSRSRDKA